MKKYTDSQWDYRQEDFIDGVLFREDKSTKNPFYEATKSNGGLHEDPGGGTKYGISERTFSKREDGVNILNDEYKAGNISSFDIPNLTKEDAKFLHKKHYLDPMIRKFGKSDIALKLADISVNIGMGNTTAIIQAALNEYGANLEVDGAGLFIGNTSDKVDTFLSSEYDEDKFMEVLTKKQKDYYISIGNDKYGKGWDNRANYNPIVGE